MDVTNRRVVLASRPEGMPSSENFRLETQTLPSEPPEGQFLVRVHYLSVDPYMRGRMREARSYADPVGIGAVMVGGAVGEVIASRHPRFPQGSFVEGPFGWQEYAVSDGQGARAVDPELAPIETALYVLGMPGMTAYFGLLKVGAPKAGETVLVSTAAGAVGSLVGQIAQIQGCRAIGIVGSEEKQRYCEEELGFQATYNYKTETDHTGRVRALCPDGVDVYFDNVGGEQLDAAILNMNIGGRISICGQISMYNAAKMPVGPRLWFQFIAKQLRAEGFLVYQFIRQWQEGVQAMSTWLREGRIQYRQRVADGIENAPAAFIEMLQGENIGKQLVRMRAAR